MASKRNEAAYRMDSAVLLVFGSLKVSSQGQGKLWRRHSDVCIDSLKPGTLDVLTADAEEQLSEFLVVGSQVFLTNLLEQ